VKSIQAKKFGQDLFSTTNFLKKNVAKISVKSFEIFNFDRFENARKNEKKLFFQNLKTFFA